MRSLSLETHVGPYSATVPHYEKAPQSLTGPLVPQTEKKTASVVVARQKRWRELGLGALVADAAGAVAPVAAAFAALAALSLAAAGFGFLNA